MRKVLFIMSSLGGGGAEKVLITLLRYFDYSRYSVDLCLINKVGVYVKDVPAEVRLITLYDDISSLSAKVEYNLYTHFGSDFMERMRIRRKVGQNYDAIISFCEGRSLKFHRYITDRSKNNISWVHTDMHNNHHTVGKIFSASDELKAYSSMQTIVCVSSTSDVQFGKEFPGVSVPRRVIVNPIPKDIITSYRVKNRTEKAFTITTVGGLRPEKGFDRVIRLASYLKRKGYDFHINIIGDGSCRSNLEALIEQEQVGDRVSLLGFVNLPYKEMSQSDLFINVSYVEAYPLVICEAMCLGIPVVSTRTAGGEALLGESEYGLLVEQNDESIMGGVERIITGERLRKHYQEKALELAGAFDVDAIVRQVYSLIG